MTRKPINGFPGYSVCDDGTVLCCIKRGRGGGALTDVWRVLKQNKDKTNGRMLVNLYSQGVGKMHKVHRLVLEAFVGERPAGLECCHKDGDPSNNNLENLYWGTPKQNARDRDSHGRTSRGEKHPDANFSDGEVILIRQQHRSGATILGLSKKYGVSLHCIWCIVHKKTWKHLVG